MSDIESIVGLGESRALGIWRAHKAIIKISLCKSQQRFAD